MPEQKEIYRPKKLSIEEIKSGFISIFEAFDNIKSLAKLFVHHADL
jgi:hypothetical protein